MLLQKAKRYAWLAHNPDKKVASQARLQWGFILERAKFGGNNMAMAWQNPTLSETKQKWSWSAKPFRDLLVSFIP